MLALRVHCGTDGAIDVRLCAAHTASSMGVGFYSSDGQAHEQHVCMLRRAPDRAATSAEGCTLEASASWTARRES